MRRWLGLSGVAVTIGGIWACSPIEDPFCPNGVSPFDGQTGVDADAVIVIRTGAEIPSDAPDLHDTVTLRQGHRNVPFHLEVDGDAGELRLIPDEPLAADAQYEVGAVDWYGLGEMPHWWGPSSFGRDYTITTFRTFSEPRLLGAYSLPDQVTLVLVFSEPMDLNTLDGRTWGSAESSSTTPEFRQTIESELSVVGFHEGDQHLVEVISAGPDEAVDLVAVRLEPGVISRSGTELSSDGASGEVRFEDGQLARYAGAPTCFFVF